MQSGQPFFLHRLQEKKYSYCLQNYYWEKRKTFYAIFPSSQRVDLCLKSFIARLAIDICSAIFKYTHNSREGTIEATSTNAVYSNAESIPKDYLFQPQLLKVLPNKVSSIVHKIHESCMTTKVNFSLSTNTLKKFKLFI